MQHKEVGLNSCAVYDESRVTLAAVPEPSLITLCCLESQTCQCEGMQTASGLCMPHERGF